MNELTIRALSDDDEANEAMIDKILDMLLEAEEEGEIDGNIQVIRNQYPR